MSTRNKKVITWKGVLLEKCTKERLSQCATYLGIPNERALLKIRKAANKRFKQLRPPMKSYSQLVAEALMEALVRSNETD